MNELNKAFELAVDEMLKEIHESRHMTNDYNPTLFKNMRHQYGAVKTAKKLVIKSHQTTGFQKLCSSGLSRLTLEALVLKPEFKDLFSATELACAEFHLSQCECLRY